MFSSKTDLWSTPQEYFDVLSKEFPFTLDVCALPENAKCKKFFSPQDDGLAQEWNGICWMNPPYGRAIGKWVQKAYESAKAGLLWLDCFRQEQIPNGSMITFTERQKYVLSVDG
jgi:phage N-6-adenine-methyltransferase